MSGVPEFQTLLEASVRYGIPSEELVLLLDALDSARSIAIGVPGNHVYRKAHRRDRTTFVFEYRTDDIVEAIALDASRRLSY